MTNGGRFILLEVFLITLKLLKRCKNCVNEKVKDQDVSVNSIQQEEKYFHQQTGIKFKEETSKVLHLEHSFVWC
jgi:hypothetical protein